MKTKILSILLVFSIGNLYLFAQDWADEKEEDVPLFFIGINAGAFFPNNNTAIIYNGTSASSSYGINYILNIPSYKTTFDTYFKHPYSISEYPLKSSYKTALNIGLHTGVNLGGGNTIYMDINSATLNYEQFFTIAIDDPNNQSPEPTYEQLPIIGKEKRFNFNLGTQLSFFNKDKTTIYWSIFGNFNSIKLERNYIVINNREYEIIHTNPLQANVKPGGIGYGGGSGIGFKYRVTDRILIDLSYNLYYIKSKMNDNIQDFGLNHGVTFRLIWN